MLIDTGCFLILATVLTQSTAVNIGVHLSFCNNAFIFFQIYTQGLKHWIIW